MDSKHIIPADPIAWIIEHKDRLLKYFGTKTIIVSIRYRSTVTAKDFNDKLFNGWLFTMKYTSAVGTRTDEIVIDFEGYLRTVSGYGTGRTIYSHSLKYYRLFPEFEYD